MGREGAPRGEGTGGAGQAEISTLLGACAERHPRFWLPVRKRPGVCELRPAPLAVSLQGRRKLLPRGAERSEGHLHLRPCKVETPSVSEGGFSLLRYSQSFAQRKGGGASCEVPPWGLLERVSPAQPVYRRARMCLLLSERMCLLLSESVCSSVCTPSTQASCRLVLRHR